MLFLVVSMLVVPVLGCRESLHKAVKSGNIKTVMKLVQSGADVNARDADGDTPLQIAARIGLVDIAGLLISHGANIDARSNHGYTALHDACATGRGAGKVVELLFPRGLTFTHRRTMG